MVIAGGCTACGYCLEAPLLCHPHKGSPQAPVPARFYRTCSCGRDLRVWSAGHFRSREQLWVAVRMRPVASSMWLRLFETPLGCCADLVPAAVPQGTSDPPTLLPPTLPDPCRVAPNTGTSPGAAHHMQVRPPSPRHSAVSLLAHGEAGAGLQRRPHGCRLSFCKMMCAVTM